MITKVQCKMLLYLCAYTDQASNGHIVINKVWYIIEPLNYVDTTNELGKNTSKYYGHMENLNWVDKCITRINSFLCKQ